MIKSEYDTSNISAAESTRHSWDEETARLAREHDLAVRKLELEVMKQDQRWGSLLKIPITIIMLPVYFVLGLGFIAAMITKTEPGESFWSIIRR